MVSLPQSCHSGSSLPTWYSHYLSAFTTLRVTMTARRMSQEEAMKPHEKILDIGILLARKRRSIPLHTMKEVLRRYLFLTTISWTRASAGLYSAFTFLLSQFWHFSIPAETWLLISWVTWTKVTQNSIKEFTVLFPSFYWQQSFLRIWSKSMSFKILCGSN